MTKDEMKKYEGPINLIERHISSLVFLRENTVTILGEIRDGMIKKTTDSRLRKILFNEEYHLNTLSLFIPRLAYLLEKERPTID